MITQGLEIAGQLAMGIGAIFCFLGALGMIRMPDFYSRTHPASMIDTLGASLVLAGLGLYTLAGHGDAATMIRLVLIGGFLYVTSPTAAHALAKAAFARGLRADGDLARIGLSGDGRTVPASEREG